MPYSTWLLRLTPDSADPRCKDRWTGKLNAPATAAYVTLRAAARDSRGDSVDQTVYRAFGLKK